ncbi:methyltransferase [Tribonema minus]|uniref:Methyltransferase n=1 Tax=Tribonema minus TaxID=303371 RepID=A0A835YZ28_9STRA|nr:methyltransferase [Tribonema minus]
MDISTDMLDVANERETDHGDLAHHDMGTGLPFRPSTFDGVISVSALQWLCYAQTSEQSAKARLMRFFSSLYTVLKRGARAALQFYPETPEQAVLISSCAAQAGFTGGLVVDYPNSAKAKKYYLCLSFEHGYRAPQALEQEGAGAATGVRVADRERQQQRRQKGKKREAIKSKDWVLAKKSRQRQQGKETRPDSKYTGRKRKDKF